MVSVESVRIGIVVATYGEDRWYQLAKKRAVPSADAQTWQDEAGIWRVPRVTQTHLATGTLAEARNSAARSISNYVDYLIFLDGDDELAPGYVKAMHEAAMFNPGALYVPAVKYVSKGGAARAPKFWPEQDHHDGNWLVIGTMVPCDAFYETAEWTKDEDGEDVFVRSGGFEEYGLYEDWALFARMQDLGYGPQKVPDAVYVAHRSNRSRNNAHPKERLYWHQKIGADLWPDLYEQPTPDEDEWHRLRSRNVRRIEAA
jgi:GT2 family glycosyltransferase